MKNMFNSSLVDKIFIVILAILLILPISHINHDEKSITENRMLATYPEIITQENKINNKYGVEYDKWFSDRFFGRNILIKFYGFHKNDTKGNLKVLSEKDNWLFFSASLRDFANIDTFSEQELSSAASFIRDIDEWCKKHKKQFVFVIAPDKNKVYGEHVTKILKVRPDSQSKSEQLIEYLKSHTNANVLYLRNVLVANKSKGLLYWKNDTHWNEYGAYIGYLAIMDVLKIKPINIKSFRTETKPRGDLTNMATNIPEDKNTLYLVPDMPNKANNPCEFGSSNDTHCESRNYTVNKSIFTFHDSFSVQLGSYYMATFKNIDSRWRYNINADDLEYIKNNADIVVLEIVERNIDTLSNQHFPKD